MRGVVSAGMTAAIEQLGLRDAFDEVHGASAGAFNGAFLLAGQAAYLTALYPHGFGDPSFVSFRDTLLRRRPIFDMDYVIGEVWRHQRPLRTDEILTSGIDLHCTATDVDSARDRRPHRPARRRGDPLRHARLGPAAVAGRAAGAASAAAAGWTRRCPRRSRCTPLATATDMLVLQTRPHGVAAHAAVERGRAPDRPLPQKLNPALVELRADRSERYDQLSDELAARAATPTRAGGVRDPPPGRGAADRPDGEPPCALTAAGSHGLRAAWMALEGEDPELLSAPRAYPARRVAGGHEAAAASSTPVAWRVVTQDGGSALGAASRSGRTQAADLQGPA